MRLWDLVEKEENHFRTEIDGGPLEPRTWECEPLLVINESDDSVVFEGHSDVDVTPHEDGTALLVAKADVNGWHPTLPNAEVRTYSAPGQIGGARDGLVARGADANGTPFTWYINGAADYFGAQRLEVPMPSSLPPETP